MKNLLLSLLLLPALAFGAVSGDLVENKWVQISIPSGTGSTMLSVSNGFDQGQLDGIMTWSGGAFASNYGSRGTLFVFGGGHTDYDQNDVYSFDVQNGTWRQFMPRSSPAVCNTATTRYADGRPCGGQNYDFVEYSP